MSQLTYRASGLPPGMQLSSSGILSGISSDNGRYDFTVTAQDNITNKTLTQKYTAIIGSDICSSESIDSIPHLADPTTYTVGYPIQPNIIFTPLGNNRWFLSSDTLPPGLVLDGNGFLSGTPTKTGKYHFEVNVNTYFGCNYNKYYTINVNPQLTFSAISRDITFASDSIPLPPQYTFAFYPSSDVSAVSFVSSDNTLGQFRFQGAGLPPGTVLNSLTGQLSGTVSDIGTYGFSITARNINTNESLTQNYTAIISSDVCSSQSISSFPTLSNPTTYTIGTPITPVYFSPTGKWFASTNWPLPPGLTLNVNGVLSGIPTEIGTYPFQINVNTSNGCQYNALYTIQVVAQQKFTAIANNLANVSDATALPSNYTFAFTRASDISTIPFVSSDSGSQYWTASGLPMGTQINSTTGQLSGIVSDFGKFDFSVSKRNLSNNGLITQNYSMVITSDIPPIMPISSIPLLNLFPTPNIFKKGVPIQPNITLTPLGFNQYFAATQPVAAGLPPGLSLNQTFGLISGIPTQTGTWNNVFYGNSPTGEVFYGSYVFSVSD